MYFVNWFHVKNNSSLICRLLAMLLPIGSIVKTSTGHDVRMNGFYTLIGMFFLHLICKENWFHRKII